jgi:hypothetical protein
LDVKTLSGISKTLGDAVDYIELLKAALFGLVEGITEWLPI